MRIVYWVALLGSVSLLLFPLLAFSQTGMDTATFLSGGTNRPGTVMRGVAKPTPVKPAPLEQNLPQPIASTLQQGVGIKQRLAKTPATLIPVPARVGVATPTPQVATPVTPTRNREDATDTVLTNAYRKALVAYYRSVERQNITTTVTYDSVSSYYAWALKNRQSIITRQQTTGSLIFLLVITVVLVGLVFSAIQFYIALKSVHRKGSFTDTSLKASLSGVEVSSSVLGVIILTLSIVFFYLYLTNVYPLVSLDQIPAQTAMKAEKVPLTVAK